MKRLLLALGLCLGLSSSALSQPTAVGPANAILCNQIANMAVGPTTSTRLVQGVLGRVIVVCGWHVTNTGAAGTFTFTTGTGGTCGTGTATVIVAQSVSNTAPSADHQSFAFFSTSLVNTGTPTDFCITPSVATIAATVYFAQF